MGPRELFLIFGLMVFAWASCSADPACPEEDDGDAQLYEDPDNCGAFYECSHGVAYLFECPNGLYFNGDLKVCDLPNDVDCGTRPVIPVTTTSTDLN